MPLAVLIGLGLITYRAVGKGLDAAGSTATTAAQSAGTAAGHDLAKGAIALALVGGGYLVAKKQGWLK